jgi:tetratricopeptide (TPR) repeat protein
VQHLDLAAEEQRVSARLRIGYLETVRTAAPADAKPESPFTRRWLAALLFGLTLVAYLPVIENGYIWDDDDYVYANPTLQSADGLRQMWFELGAIPQYYPLVHTGFWLEYRLWGDAPHGYHAVNVVLHALCALLFWRVLVLLKVPGAWWVAALFSLHPVQVESVAWITERKNVQSGALYFASLLAYLRWRGTGAQPRLYAVSLLLFVAALLSKSVTASLPAVVLVLIWWQREPLDRDAWRPLIPFFAVGALFGAATSIYERVLVGAIGPAWDLSTIERVLVAGRALWFYLAKLAWPLPLVFNYPRWSIDAAEVSQYAYPAAALLLGLGLWLASARIGRGALSAAMIFAGTLLPALGFFNVYPMRYSFVADHFQYLACAAPFAYVTAVAFRGLDGRPSARIGLRVVLGALLALFALLDWQRLPDYRDAETLWRATLNANPRSWQSHSALCAIEHGRAELERAGPHCEAMLALEPDNHESHHMFAIYQASRGRTEAGIRHYERAIEIEPRYHHALNGLAATLNGLGRFDEAVAHLRRAIVLNPEFAEAHSNLGNALVATGEIDAGVAEHRAAVGLAPDNAVLHNNLAAGLLRAGQPQLARAHLVRVTQLLPDSKDAARNLAALDRLLKRQPRPSEPPE